MRLTATDLAAVRGGRTVFAGLSFRVGAGELLAVTGAERRGQIDAAPAHRRAASRRRPARSRSTRPAKAASPAVVHYLGHLDALKPALTRPRESRLLAAALGRRSRSTRRSSASASARSPTFRSACSPPASGGARRSRGCSSSPRPLWLLDEPTTSLDAAAEAMLGRLIGAHLAAGGMAIVAHPPRLCRSTPTATLDARRRMIAALAAIAGQTARLSLRSGGGASSGSSSSWRW